MNNNTHHAILMLAGLLLWCASTGLHARDLHAHEKPHASTHLIGHFALLNADVGMMQYEPENSSHVDAIQQRMQQLAPVMEQWLASLPAEPRQFLTGEWRGMRAQLLGDGDQPGLVSGYDSYAHAQYSAHRDVLRDALTRDAVANATDLDTQAYVQMARILSGYMLVAASPFGSFAMSTEDEDADLATLAQTMDTQWNRLLQQAPADSALRDAHTKWLFIRGSVLRATEASLPYIVNRNARQILLVLASENSLSL